MSGGNNGGQQPGQTSSTQTQQTTSTTEPSPTIQPFLKQLVGSLGGVTAGGITPPSLYSGPMVAAPSQATQSGWQTMAQRGSAGLGYGIDPFNKTLTADTLAGKYLDINNNPYFKSALAAGFAPQTENFNNNIVPNLRAQFAGSGRNLGGLDVDTVLRATKDLDQTQANASATAANNAYGAERGIQLQTQGLLPGMANMDWQNVAGIAGAGAGIDQYNQAKTNEAVLRDTYNKTGLLDWLTKLGQTAQGLYPGGTTAGSGTSTGTSTMMPPSNPTASGIGAGLAGAGTIAQFLPFFGFSDVRLKKNVRGPVGRTNSGHNLYAYEFLGSSKPEIGVLAQEVERKDPAAIVAHPSGYKMVNYGRVAAPAGGLR